MTQEEIKELDRLLILYETDFMSGWEYRRMKELEEKLNSEFK